MANATQVANFIARIAPIAQDQARKHGNKVYPSICIAQACCESAFGTSGKMVKANAVFGIKVGKSAWKFGTAWKGAAYKTGTTEYYDGKNPTKITDYFRAYDSIEDSVEDYFDLLCNSKRYQYALNQPTPQKCIEGIQKAPYATSPTYVQTIMGIVNKYGLTKYDGANTANTANANNSSNSSNTNRNPYKEPVKNVRRGSRGNDVRWVQYELNKRGYGLIVDGIAGEKAEAAIIHFQQKTGLVPDGICGAKTRAALLGS